MNIKIAYILRTTVHFTLCTKNIFTQQSDFAYHISRRRFRQAFQELPREDDSVDTRELFARLIECEAGGEGEDGMKAVATVIMNRATVPYGEFARVSNGGDIRAIIEQAGQFVCMMTTVGGEYNPQNVYNISPSSESYEIADWAIDGNLFNPVANSLFFMNPYSARCPTYFPVGGIGVAFNRIGDHCFYVPTEKYAQT